MSATSPLMQSDHLGAYSSMIDSVKVSTLDESRAIVDDAPEMVRQRSKEEEKEEVDVFLPVSSSFRRQSTFSHTVRPVPVLQDDPKYEYYAGLLRNMGFNQSEIDKALVDAGEKGIEEVVEKIVASRKGETQSEKEEKKEIQEEKSGEQKASDPTMEETKEIPNSGLLRLRTESISQVGEDWKCRYCDNYENSFATEVCIQCNRSRILCEALSDQQMLLRRQSEDIRTKKTEEMVQQEIQNYTQKLAEEEKLENGPWPCRFCDYINPSEFSVCKSCNSAKYLSRLLLTNIEWMTKIEAAQESKKREEEEDRIYREEWEKKKASGGTVECLICFDEVPVKEIVFASCKHNFCATCWNGYLETKVKDGDVLKLNCPAIKCKRPVQRSEIKARLNAEMFEKFNRFYTTAQLSLNPNSRWCPTPDCETVMFGSKNSPRLICPKCQHAICFKCNHDWHTGTCELAARGLMGVAADRAAFAAYALVANIKPCPQCRTPIAKDEGCNHMTCQRCHYEFCWMCRGRYDHNHFAWWNLLGCPGGQAGILACLGDDRCLCIDCGCGCGLLGMLKRTLLKLLYLSCFLACCPCLSCVALYNICRC